MNDSTAQPRTLNSTGCIASIVGAPPAKIVTTADRLGIEPAMRINGIAHFDDQQVERIAAALKIDRSKK
jgi:hypothetical protein